MTNVTWLQMTTNIILHLSMDLRSTEFDGKDWRMICTQFELKQSKCLKLCYLFTDWRDRVALPVCGTIAFSVDRSWLYLANKLYCSFPVWARFYPRHGQNELEKVWICFFEKVSCCFTLKIVHIPTPSGLCAFMLVLSLSTLWNS